MSLQGQIGIVRFAPLFSPGWWIQTITDSNTCHCVIALDDETCVSADPSGVQVRRIDSFGSDGSRLSFSNLPLTPEQAEVIAAFAAARVGRPYAFLDDALLGWSSLSGKRLPKVFRWWLGQDVFWMCSELAAASLFAGTGIRIRADREPPEITPGDVEDFFQIEGWA